MDNAWRATPDRAGPVGKRHGAVAMHCRRQAGGGILVDALLFWLLTGAMLGTIGMLLYYTRGAAP